MVKAYEEFFSGYRQDPKEVLERVFDEVEGYDDLVLVRDIPFFSHCEHHVVPFVGKAHIAYYPTDGVVGLSKLARLVDVFAKRLQTQEAHDRANRRDDRSGSSTRAASPCWSRRSICACRCAAC